MPHNMVKGVPFGMTNVPVRNHDVAEIFVGALLITSLLWWVTSFVQENEVCNINKKLEVISRAIRNGSVNR